VSFGSEIYGNRGESRGGNYKKKFIFFQKNSNDELRKKILNFFHKIFHPSTQASEEFSSMQQKC
jgi:hypothetical protein